MTRPNVKFSNLSALYLHKQAELSQPKTCRCESNAEAIIGIGIFILMLGMVLGVWLCQTYWR